MKTLSLSVFLIFLLLAGCKKENSNSTPVNNTQKNNTDTTTTTTGNKTYLLNKATYVSVITAVDVYTYDSKNRVVDYNSGRIRQDYKYTYDDNDNLVSTAVYNSSNQLLYTEQYTSAGSTIDAQRFDPNGKPTLTYTYTINAQQEATAISSSRDAFSYDSNGNLTSYAAVNSLSDTLTYDNKKNPLSMMGAKNLHLMYQATGYFQTFVNNIATTRNIQQAFTYRYNSDGFPVSANVVSSDGNYTIKYDYITK